MRILLLVAALALPAIALADPNAAPECNAPPGVPALGVVQIGNDPSLAFYVDDRNYLVGNGIWIYQESNGVFSIDNEPIWNLQRGSASGWPWPDDGEICFDNHPAGPDYLLF